MNEEVWKAIEKIRSFNQYNWELNNLKTKEFAKPYFDSLDTILNLIEKQSKEIEELTLDLEEMTKSNNHKKENWVHKNILNSYVSKDKIKEKIKELNKEYEEYKNGQEWEIQDDIQAQISILQELLEE